MRIGVPKETAEGERRVALVPDIVRKLSAQGHEVVLEPGAGTQAGIPDELFEQAGAIASEDCAPIPDSRGPVDYKRHLAGVLTKRALRRATARALQQEA